MMGLARMISSWQVPNHPGCLDDLGRSIGNIYIYIYILKTPAAGHRPHPNNMQVLLCVASFLAAVGAGMAEVISIVKFTRVEFTMEITSSAGRTKLKEVWGWVETDAEIKRKHNRKNSR